MELRIERPMPRLNIDGREISDATRCFVIAELGHNHQGSVDKCKELIRAAKASGCSAVKLQKRNNESLFTRAYFDSAYRSPHAFGATYGAHRAALEFGRDEYLTLISYAREIGITLFATPFDEESLRFLADLDIPAFKVASADLRSGPLLDLIASQGKPVILSTGGSSMEEVRGVVDRLYKINSQLALLQCTAAYPAANANLNLRVISTFRETFPHLVVGYSGHELGTAPSLAAFALGARIIERHFTLDRTLKGSDHQLSLEPDEMTLFVRQLDSISESLGDGRKRLFDCERDSIIKMGKKIVARRDLVPGHRIALEDLAFKSPGDGVSPDQSHHVVGRTLKCSVRRDESILLEALGEEAA